MRVYVGSDHAGYSLRKTLVERMRSQGREVEDLGTDSEAACDYPEFAYVVANAVRGNPGSLGILCCATGQGMAIAAGKVRGIRAVVPATVEAARLSRFDNDANVLCLGGRFLSESEAMALVDTWLSTGFAGGRHARRIAKVAAIETAASVAFMTEGERIAISNQNIPARLFDRDPTLFSDQEVAHPALRDALAWILLPADGTAKLPDVTSFATEIRKSKLRDLILLVDDVATSSVAAVARFWGPGPGALRLHLLGGATPSGLPALEDAVQLGSALVLVCGSAIDAHEQGLWVKLLALCGGDAQQAGSHFVAITHAHSRLAKIAKDHAYRRVFSRTAGVGEAFTPLGFDGLLPAALLGVDVGRLLARTTAMVDGCRGGRIEDNPGASLGVLLGALTKHGRNKVTLIPSRSLLPLGHWIVQVLTAATKDCERRIVALCDEPVLQNHALDRIFLQLQAGDDPPALPSEQIEALHIAGQPFIQIAVRDRYELGAELFRWEFAATVAALVLGGKPLQPSAPAGYLRETV